MRFRKLRIAWSVACGIACVLMIALWVRSLWRYDHVFFPGPHRIASMDGQLSWDENFIVNGPIPTSRYDLGAVHFRSISGNVKPSSVGHSIPHWLLAVIAAAGAAAAWLPSRFSLRTLLIATSLFAVLLGLSAYMLRN
jgi:hypothetical protein